jgi:hypothetical protein
MVQKAAKKFQNKIYTFYTASYHGRSDGSITRIVYNHLYKKKCAHYNGKSCYRRIQDTVSLKKINTEVDGIHR